MLFGYLCGMVVMGLGRGRVQEKIRESIQRAANSMAKSMYDLRTGNNLASEYKIKSSGCFTSLEKIDSPCSDSRLKNI